MESVLQPSTGFQTQLTQNSETRLDSDHHEVRMLTTRTNHLLQLVDRLAFHLSSINM